MSDAHRGRLPLDRTLVERARDGDRDAFETLMKDRIDRVYRLSLAIVANEADARDATQEAFVAAWRQLPRLRDADRFEAWLSRLVINSARMALRARRRRGVREIPAHEILSGFGAHDPSIGDGVRLAAALGRLAPDQRAILALHHLEDRSIAEIASILDIPPGTVKSRLFTARQALVRALGDAS
jgi:RNA polymerase sigma-70 factor (ECF subfamily)